MSRFSNSWLFKLLYNFVAVSPAMALVSTLSSLISKVSMVLAFLLPMKVIILISSEKVPDYFLPIVNRVGWDALVIGLGVFSGFLYVVHIVSSKISDKCTLRGYNLLEIRNSKLMLFEGQEEFMHGSYKRISSILSSVVFVMLSSLFYAVYYPEVLLLSVVITFFGATYILRRSRIQAESIIPSPDLSRVLNLIQGAAFFGIFSYVLVDFLYIDPPDFIVVLVSIIAFRIMLGNVVSCVRDFHFLLMQKNKIDAVYFRDQIFLSNEKKGKDSVWGVMEKEVIDTWLPRLIEKATGQDWTDYQINWRQSGVPDLLFILVKSPSLNRRCLIKIYHKKHGKRARHEASLLLSNCENIPAPKLLLSTLLYGYHFHVLDFDGVEVCPNSTKISPRDFQFKLMGVYLPEGIVDQYRRSHPMASTMLKESDFFNLRVSVGNKASKSVSQLLNEYSGMCEVMDELPLVLNSPVKKDWIVKNKNQELLLIEWGGWKIEQGAVGWPAKEDYTSEIANKLPYLYKVRPSLQEVSVEKMQFSCLFHEFFRGMKSQRYEDVAEMLPAMMDMYSKACQTNEISFHAS